MIGAALVWWTALAFATDPAAASDNDGAAPRATEDASEPDPPAPVPDAVPMEEITVYAEEQVRRAKERVVERLDQLGYDTVERVGDREVYRHAEPWKGEVVLHEDGWTLVRRQPMHVEGRRMPWTKEGTAVAWVGCLVYPWFCIRLGGATISSAKWRGVEGRVVEQMHTDVQAWGDRIADLHTRRKVATLPEALEALWEVGLALDPATTTPLTTPQARRQALLAYWDSRTDTVWGDEVRGTVEAFCRAVVQTSDHPFTEAEIAAFNASRSARDPFDLNRRRGAW